MNAVAKLLLFVFAASAVSLLLLLAAVDVSGLFQNKVYIETRRLKPQEEVLEIPVENISKHHIIGGAEARNVIQLPSYIEDLKSILHKEPQGSHDLKDAINSEEQQKLVNRFCARHGMHDMAYQIPQGTWIERKLFYKHILFDDHTKLIFAYLPKVASSHIRRFVCVLSKIFPIGTVFARTVSVKKMDFCVHNSTFLNRNLQDSDRVERMKKYWKVAILRNPLERLVSAYRDKIIGENRKPHEKEWANEIMEMYNVSDVTFETYLQWIVDTPNKVLNEHFTPLFILASPCIVRYHYYGNFKRLSEEMQLISGQLHVHRRLFSDFDYHEVTNRTEKLMADYFATASAAIKKSLFWDFYMEFDFYFSLFPEEKGSIKLLEVDEVL